MVMDLVVEQVTIFLQIMAKKKISRVNSYIHPYPTYIWVHLKN
jgi:hypothetical protein